MFAGALEFVTPDGQATVPTKRLAEALAFLETLPNAPTAKDEFDRNVLDAKPADFFKHRVRTIVVGAADSSQCEGGHLAFVSPSAREEKRMWVCPLTERYDVVTVSAALVHEARHEDGAEFDHQFCHSGPNKGKMACDESYEQGGSYAVGLEYLVKLARNPELPPEIRKQARAAAVRDFLSRFNVAPLDIRNGALLEKEDGQLVFYDGSGLLALDIPHAPGQVLTVRGGLPVFFERDQVTQFDYAPTLGPAFTDLLVRDYLATKPEDLLDVLYADQYACMLLVSKLRCYRPDRTVVERAYEFTPERFVYAPFSRVLAAGSIFVRDSEGAHHRLPDDFAGPWESAPLTLKAIAPWPGGEISLEADGRVHVLSYRTRRWDDGPAGVYRRLIAPFSWSTRLNAL